MSVSAMTCLEVNVAIAKLRPGEAGWDARFQPSSGEEPEFEHIGNMWVPRYTDSWRFSGPLLEEMPNVTLQKALHGWECYPADDWGYCSWGIHQGEIPQTAIARAYLAWRQEER